MCVYPGSPAPDTHWQTSKARQLNSHPQPRPMQPLSAQITSSLQLALPVCMHPRAAVAPSYDLLFPKAAVVVDLVEVGGGTRVWCVCE